ncbi:hypothetical protein DKX38_001928 [Salix brachista]|uniref:Uncharacterized protein n=1 Tax=Salix brachista TaxID=2182728 RepID=A0A5N5NKL6_9ROSI|nr:hypothetical protein DKX38_001928 [Salix brachista]
MGVSQPCRYCILLCVFLIFLVFFICNAQVLSTVADQHVLDVPPGDDNTPARASPPVAAPTLNIVPPFGKPLSNQGQQSPLGYRQQQELNQPRSGLTQPLSSPNQPLSGTSVPFSALNQPFGASDSQNLLRNLPFASEVSVASKREIRLRLLRSIRDCDVLGGQDNQRTIGGVCYDGTQGENAKVGEKGRLVFSVHGMTEKKENGIWEKDNTFPGRRCRFCCKIYCQTPPAVCSTSEERCTRKQSSK